MGDFEKTFGAGADAVAIVDGFGRNQADEYRIAKVRFSESGKPYPVNCVFNVEPGDFVIVRLEGHFTNLQMAEVVEADIIWKGACKHTAMCRAENAERYGKGSDGVQTQEELDRFLTGGMGYHKYPISDPSLLWHTAYVSLHCPVLDAESVWADFIIVLGNHEIAYYGPGYPNPDGHHLPVSNGAITRIPFIAARFKGPDIYKKAAKFAESELYQPI